MPYQPFISVLPYPSSRSHYICDLEESKRGFGSHDFNLDFVVLYDVAMLARSYCAHIDWILTADSSETIRGAFIEATLPVKISTTCVNPSFLSLSETKAVLAMN